MCAAGQSPDARDHCQDDQTQQHRSDSPESTALNRFGNRPEVDPCALRRTHRTCRINCGDRLSLLVVNRQGHVRKRMVAFDRLVDAGK